MRITVWRDKIESCFLYRLGYPLWEAQSQGIATIDFRTRWNVEEVAATDVLVAQRMYTPDAIMSWLDAVEALPSSTLRVLEYDDDLLRLRPDSSYRAGLTSAEYRQLTGQLQQAMHLADLVTVTTPHLAAKMAEHTDIPVVVLPNTIHALLLEQPAPRREPGTPLRVGWAGGPTHDLDWTTCRRGIREGLSAAHAELVIGGSDVRKIVDYPATFRPAVQEMGDYYAMISDFQVQLAPLADDEFNRSKSPLKALEAAALGIPTVAADVTPYREFIVDGQTGFLCRTAADWKRAITALAADEDLRLEMGARARERAAELTTQGWAPRWVGAYETALSAKRGAALPA